MISPRKYDPTGTTQLRNKYVADVSARFTMLEKVITQKVVEGNFFGGRKVWNVGGPGSGNFGHAGRPGEVGGSGEGGSVVYHGTYASIADTIKTEGLKPGIGGRVFASTDKKDALDWGRMRAKKHKDDSVALVTIADQSNFEKVPYGEDSYRAKEHVEPKEIISVEIYSVKDLEDWIYGGKKEPSPTSILKLNASDRIFVFSFRQKDQIKQNQAAHNAYDFPQDLSPERTEEFLRWLETEKVKGGLTVAQGAVGARSVGIKGNWQNKYVDSTYRKGMVDGYVQLKRSIAKNLPPDNPIIKAVRQYDSAENFMTASLAMPVSVRKLQTLNQRQLTELKGISDDMARRISNQLTSGVLEGKGPIEVARAMVKETGMSKVRAKMMARTEIIRAHNEAKLDTFQALGVEGVTAEVEWSTAGDDKVCEECQEGAEGPDGPIIYSLEEARGLLPAHPNCLLDGQVPVFTSKGWIPIRDVKVDDLVLTHKGHFCRVTHLHQNVVGGQAVKIHLTGVSGNKSYLGVTAEHPILVKRGKDNQWVSAQDVKKGDILFVLGGECKRCKKKIPVWRKYCSYTCRSLDITDRQWADPKHRENISRKNSISMDWQYETGLRDGSVADKAHEKVRELIAAGGWEHTRTPEFRERAGNQLRSDKVKKIVKDRMTNHNPMASPVSREKARKTLKKWREANPDKHPNRIMAQRGHSTWIEKVMADVLARIGVPFEREYCILRFWADFALVEKKIVIECDGEFWHKNKVADDRRQKLIESEGWRVLRFTGHEINWHTDDVAVEIVRVLQNHDGEYFFSPVKVKSVHKWELTRRKRVYNLSVDEDETYLANGIVVHNCRCSWIPYLAPIKGEEGYVPPEGEEQTTEEVIPEEETATEFDETTPTEPEVVAAPEVQLASDSALIEKLLSSEGQDREYGYARTATGVITEAKPVGDSSMDSYTPGAVAIVHTHPADYSMSISDVLHAGRFARKNSGGSFDMSVLRKGLKGIVKETMTVTKTWTSTEWNSTILPALEKEERRRKRIVGKDFHYANPGEDFWKWAVDEGPLKGYAIWTSNLVKAKSEYKSILKSIKNFLTGEVN